MKEKWPRISVIFLAARNKLRATCGEGEHTDKANRKESNSNRWRQNKNSR